ncbi:expressed unknown protein [Seminavis robusta]|uniref:Uncharacterized protein n=1 Tax=Seminavis robusta TaxID=568900 RepID=A0A9N8HRR7_9STRA|nr:expressed unknown protein [Seminavis robusta]|eukprot:Sro1431_g272020.1 n/a (156) ;mRNA; f:14144-14611
MDWVHSAQGARNHICGLEWSMYEGDIEEALRRFNGDRNGGNVAEKKDSEGRYLLWEGIDEAASLRIIEMIVQQAPDVLKEADSEYGQLALARAITEGHPDVNVLQLLATQYPAACTHRDRKGRTPMDILEEQKERNPSFYTDDRYEKVCKILQRK